MAELKRSQSAANVSKDSLIYTLTALVNDLAAAVNELKADFNAHTHNADGAQVGSYYTSPPRSDAATVTAGTALTIGFTDVDTIKFKETNTAP